MGRVFPIELVPYDPSWPDLFRREADLLRSKLPSGVVTRIEHYGSTAIPGLTAKATIDILAEVTSFEAAREVCIAILAELGYANDWYIDHMVFFKGYVPKEQPVKYHIHMAPQGHRVIVDGLLFRDYLREHPDDARRYEDLKLRLAEVHKYDREAYTDAKAEFVRGIIEKAMAGRKAE